MIEVRVWKTKDGRTFETHRQAMDHENRLTSQWMGYHTITPVDVMEKLDDIHVFDHYGTMRGMARLVFETVMNLETRDAN